MKFIARFFLAINVALGFCLALCIAGIPSIITGMVIMVAVISMGGGDGATMGIFITTWLLTALGVFIRGLRFFRYGEKFRLGVVTLPKSA